jgi:hypothetical protein
MHADTFSISRSSTNPGSTLPTLFDSTIDTLRSVSAALPPLRLEPDQPVDVPFRQHIELVHLIMDIGRITPVGRALLGVDLDGQVVDTVGQC